MPGGDGQLPSADMKTSRKEYQNMKYHIPAVYGRRIQAGTYRQIVYPAPDRTIPDFFQSRPRIIFRQMKRRHILSPPFGTAGSQKKMTAAVPHTTKKARQKQLISGISVF